MNMNDFYLFICKLLSLKTTAPLKFFYHENTMPSLNDINYILTRENGITKYYAGESVRILVESYYIIYKVDCSDHCYVTFVKKN